MPSEDKPRLQLLQGTLDLIVLRTLAAMGPQHAYAIATRVQQVSEDLLSLNQGTLYPALLRMLKAGWVSSEWGLSARNRRVRIYRISAAGRKQLAREVSAFERMLEGFRRVMGTAQS